MYIGVGVEIEENKVYTATTDKGSFRIWPSAKDPGYYYVDRVVIEEYGVIWAESTKRAMSKEGVNWWIKKHANNVNWESHKWDGKEFNYFDERPKKLTQRISTIYFIEAVGTGFVKIGRGTGRIDGLQTGCPFKLRLLCEFWSDDAPKTEKELHERFSKYHHMNEWYFLSDEIREYINKIKENYYDCSD